MRGDEHVARKRKLDNAVPARAGMHCFNFNKIVWTV
jgi:hypothetical protein